MIIKMESALLIIRVGLKNDPSVAIKMRNRSQQILVNESYEQFVARALIKASDLEIARKYAKTKLLVSHILVGHSGAYLGSPPQRTIDEALLLSQQFHSRLPPTGHETASGSDHYLQLLTLFWA